MAKKPILSAVHVRDILPRFLAFLAVAFAVWLFAATLLFVRDMINRAGESVEDRARSGLPRVDRAGLRRLEPRLDGPALPEGGGSTEENFEPSITQ